MINDLSVVSLKRQIPNSAVPIGTHGVVVMVFQDPPGYEVEFFDQAGNTIQDSKTGSFTFTLEENDIEVVTPYI